MVGTKIRRSILEFFHQKSKLVNFLNNPIKSLSSRTWSTYPCSIRLQQSYKKKFDTLLGFFNRGGVEDTRLEAKAKDRKKIRGQGQRQPFRGQTLSRPRTGMLEAKAKDQGHKAQVLSKKKKKRSSQKFFKRSPRKNVFQNIFQPLHKILTFQKLVLSSSRGQANFRGLEASRPRPRTWPSRPRPRTSKCVLEDSTSVF